LHHARGWIKSRHSHGDILGRADRANPHLPISSTMGAHDVELGVTLGKLNHVVGSGSGFGKTTAQGGEPLVLEDRPLQFDGALGNRIHSGDVAARIRLDLTDGHHRAVTYATVELLEAKLGQPGAKIDSAI